MFDKLETILKPSIFYLLTIIAIVALLLITRFGGVLGAVGFNLSNFEIFLLSFQDPLDISTDNSSADAQKYSDLAITFAPQSSGALFTKARLALLEDDIPTAGEFLYQVDRPGNQTIDWLKGYVFYQAGDHAAAMDTWKRLGYGRQIVDMGVRAAEAGNLEGALSLYKIAVDVDPNYANAHYALGSAYAGQGNFELAERSLLKALELSPKTWWYNLQLAQVYDHFDRRAQAIEYYRIALAQNPSLDNVKARLAELEGQ